MRYFFQLYLGERYMLRLFLTIKKKLAAFGIDCDVSRAVIQLFTRG